MSTATATKPETGIIFSADKYTIKPNEFHIIDAASFNSEMNRMLPWVKDHKVLPSDDWTKAVKISDDLTFGVRPFATRATRRMHRFDFSPTEKRNTLDVYPSGQRATVAFTDTVNIPVIAQRGDVVMSFTPMEVISMRVGWKRAKGKVLIGGLGLGMLARQSLLRKTVKHVTVVEASQAVIDLVGPSLVSEFGDRIEIIRGDIYDHLLTGCTVKDVRDAHYGRAKDKKALVSTRWMSAINYDQILIDIWNGVSGKYDDDVFQDLTKHIKEVWGWGYNTRDNSRF